MMDRGGGGGVGVDVFGIESGVERGRGKVDWDCKRDLDEDVCLDELYGILSFGF